MNLGQKLVQRMIENNKEYVRTQAEREAARRKLDELNREQVANYIDRCKLAIIDYIDNDRVDFKPPTMPVHDAFQNYNPETFKYKDILYDFINWGAENGLIITFETDPFSFDNGKPARYYLVIKPLDELWEGV